jgi:hypothetical protein
MKTTILVTNISPCVPAAIANAPSCVFANTETIYEKRVAESEYKTNTGNMYPT